MKATIGITIGDPAGVGPEVVAAALSSGSLPPDCAYQVIGQTTGFRPGCPDLNSARHALSGLETAAGRIASGQIQAVVTGPVSKQWLHKAGFTYPGQTEFFADRAGVSNYAMCLTGGQITVALVTAHIPLREVPAKLTADEIVRVGSLLASFTLRRGISHPRIAVAGLNPHAGEGGDLGVEEVDIIAPAIAELNRKFAGGAQFSGPWSPDTLFHRVANCEFDAVVSMYHDQGLIPLKLHAFDQGVNVTLGLPFPRTSPDHGTAFDIAGKGIARPHSLVAAIRLACEMVRKSP